MNDEFAPTSKQRLNILYPDMYVYVGVPVFKMNTFCLDQPLLNGLTFKK